MNLRPATRRDVAAISVIHRRAAFLPPLQTAQESLRFIRDRLMIENRIWVAETGGQVIGYIAFNDDWVSHLFVDPEHQGQGHGPELLAQALADRRERQLWTFEKNVRARRFYEARGWTLAELTDGQGNDHNEPEVRYVWRPR